jgi:hypothetical protein
MCIRNSPCNVEGLGLLKGTTSFRVDNGVVVLMILLCNIEGLGLIKKEY